MSSRLTDFKSKKLSKSLLRSLKIPTNLLDRYDEPHRFYHNWDHIASMFEQCDGKILINLIPSEELVLILSILFHDIVYDPKANDNEEQSVKLFKKHYNNKLGRYDSWVDSHVTLSILETKTHKPSFLESETLSDLDLSILYSSMPELLAYEEKIFKEFQFVDWSIYKEKRCEILEKFADDLGILELHRLTEAIKMRKPNIGIYAGSFNPFHIGHLNILKKAEAIFDKVIVAQGVNPDKGNSEFNPPNLPNQIIQYQGLLTDMIENMNIFRVLQFVHYKKFPEFVNNKLRNIYDSSTIRNI
jgi:pantetheine-phosphate adenylyltransferase